MKKFFIFILALITSMCLQASVIIDGIAYNLDEVTKTAEVTQNIVSVGVSQMNYPGVTTISIPATVKYNDVTYIVTAIGENAFFGCDQLASVKIGTCVRSIGNTAFCNCTSLSDITMSHSVTSIGERAFVGCMKIKHIEIGAGVKTISEKAFWGLSYVEEIKCYAATPPSLGANCFQDIPTNIIVRVPEASENAYNDAAGWSAFTHKMTFLFYSGECGAEGDNLIWTLNDRGDFFFYGSGEMTNWTGDSPWTPYSTSIKRVWINEGATSVGVYAFYSCTTMKQLVLPETLKKIGNYAFIGCSGFTHVALPEELNSIGQCAFQNCTGLTSLIIPGSVTNIGSHAFHDCTGLTSLWIKEGILNIGSNAFRGCAELTSITCEATTPPVCGNNCFYDVSKSIPVNVPFGKAAAYKAADGWKEFTNIQAKDDPTALDRVNGEEMNGEWQKVLRNGQLFILRDGKVYTVTGQRVE